MIHAAFSEKPTISVGSTETPLGKVKKKKKIHALYTAFFIYCCFAVDYKKKRTGKKMGRRYFI